MTEPRLLLGPEEIERAVGRLVSGLKDMIADPKQAALVGIRTHGVTLALRVHKLLALEYEWDLPQGILDVTLYRDDILERESQPVVRETRIDFDITGKTVVLVDDVLYTGRTARCALDALMDMGRPERVLLVVLVDRGLRELPIQPDLVGAQISTSEDQVVEVRFLEADGEDGVWVRTVPDQPS